MEELSRQLDLFLSSYRFRNHLISLRISNTPMTRLPASVCQLLNLRTLYLADNKLTELPDNCFTNMTKLHTLSVSRNSITALRDGIFDGLQRLETLDLSHNQIAFIGLHVFSNSSELTSLHSLDLSYNKITYLEPWWYYRCIAGQRPFVRIDLSHNLISKFTNNLQFKFRCDMKPPFGQVDFGFNPKVHAVDILNGWNVTVSHILKCLYNIQGPIPPIYVPFRGLTLPCDCINFEIFKHMRNTPLSSILEYKDCSVQKLNNNNSFNMIDFVCDLSDRCPSSCQCIYRPENATLHVYTVPPLT